jgi:hypothetical protein
MSRFPASVLVPYFDGSASWWTQGMGHAYPALGLAASNAAGRCRHVLFPQTATAPVADLARRLLSTCGIGAGWAPRVFFSDNGSTGMEVAVRAGDARGEVFGARCWVSWAIIMVRRPAQWACVKEARGRLV